MCVIEAKVAELQEAVRLLDAAIDKLELAHEQLLNELRRLKTTQELASR